LRWVVDGWKVRFIGQWSCELEKHPEESANAEKPEIIADLRARIHLACLFSSARGCG